jgi:heme A synthase
MTILYTPESPDNNAIRELRNELKDLNKSLKESSRETKRISVALAILALVQMAVAILQFYFDVQTSNDRFLGSFLIVLLAVFVFWIFKSFPKE